MKGLSIIYKASDYFIVRTPSLPISIYFDLIKYKGNLITFIKSKNIYELVKNMLMASSKGMYEMLLDIEGGNAEYSEAFEYSLKKYLIRASIRATPFGLYSGVGIGKFNEKTKICINNNKSIIEVKADNKWICNVIYKLENNKNILNRLSMKFNTNTYISGNRLKNTQLSLHGTDTENLFSEYSIKNTNLVEILKEFTKNYKKYNEIISFVENHYPGVDKELIEGTLKELLDNEFLITNLKQPPYCIDNLENLILTLKSLGLNQEVTVYKEIDDLIKTLKKYVCINEDICLKKASSIYSELISKMESICKSDNYIYVNKGLILTDKDLNVEIKKDLEEFINIISNLNFNSNEYEKQFCNKVSEKYGYNTLIPLTDIIDTNKLNILNTIDRFNQINEDGLEKIRNLIDFKILESIKCGKEEVDLVEEDFKKVSNNEESKQASKIIKSFDLNVIVKRNDEKYQYYITNNIGSDRATSIYNRFYDVLKYDNRYFEMLDILKKQDYEYETNNNVIYAEIRELLPDSRTVNIRNNIKINSTSLSFSNSGNDINTEIYISDLYIKINEDDTASIIHLKSGKKVIFIKNDMLNDNGHSKLANLLYSISLEGKHNPLNILYSLYNNKYTFTPRIKYKNIIIRPKQWCVDQSMFKNLNNYSLFEKEFSNIINKLSIDRYVYITYSDNRLLLDLNSKYFYKYIYKEIKKLSDIILEEFEFDSSEEFILEDIEKNKYISEYSLSFFQKEIEDVKSIRLHKTYKKSITTDSKSFILPFEKNWIYYKLYGTDERENELINNLQKLFNNLEKADSKFFIRYKDEGGKNLRVRFKFENNEDLVSDFMNINNFFYKLRDEGMIYTASIETYLPEISRYGGINLINDVEHFFSIDSEFVMEMLKKSSSFDSEDIEFYYFLGILSILKIVYPTGDEILKALDRCTNRNDWREEYKKNRERYLKYSEMIFFNNYIDIEKTEYLSHLLEERCEIMKKIKNKLSDDENINSIHSIIFSITHMFCNRFRGNIFEEDKLMHLIRHSIRELYNRKKYYK